MTYRVAAVNETAGIFCRSKPYMSAKQAHAAALRVGDPVVVYRRSGAHWSLIIDRSTACGQLPIEQHLANVLGAL